MNPNDPNDAYKIGYNEGYDEGYTDAIKQTSGTIAELSKAMFQKGYEKGYDEAVEDTRQMMLANEEQHLKDRAFRDMSFYRP